MRSSAALKIFLALTLLIPGIALSEKQGKSQIHLKVYKPNGCTTNFKTEIEQSYNTTAIVKGSGIDNVPQGRTQSANQYSWYWTAPNPGEMNLVTMKIKSESGDVLCTVSLTSEMVSVGENKFPNLIKLKEASTSLPNNSCAVNAQFSDRNAVTNMFIISFNGYNTNC